MSEGCSGQEGVWLLRTGRRPVRVGRGDGQVCCEPKLERGQMGRTMKSLKYLKQIYIIKKKKSLLPAAENKIGRDGEDQLGVTTLDHGVQMRKREEVLEIFWKKD